MEKNSAENPAKYRAPVALLPSAQAVEAKEKRLAAALTVVAVGAKSIPATHLVTLTLVNSPPV